MSSENEEETKKCTFENTVIPQEVRIKYFPPGTSKYCYDVLPLFELENYKKKITQQMSFLKNPTYAAKWKTFREGLPDSARVKPMSLKSSKIAVFANYRRQKVPPEYYASFVAPSSPEAIFNKQ